MKTWIVTVIMILGGEEMFPRHGRHCMPVRAGLQTLDEHFALLSCALACDPGGDQLADRRKRNPHPRVPMQVQHAFQWCQLRLFLHHKRP